MQREARLVLMDQLQSLAEGEEFQMGERRRERLNDTIDELTCHHVCLKVLTCS